MSCYACGKKGDKLVKCNECDNMMHAVGNKCRSKCEHCKTIHCHKHKELFTVLRLKDRCCLACSSVCSRCGVRSFGKSCPDCKPKA